MSLTFADLVQKLLRHTYGNRNEISQDTGNALLLLAGGAVVANGSYVLVLDDAASSSSGNVFNSWAALYAAQASSLVSGPRLVQVVGTSHMTAGTFDLNGWTFVPKDEFTAELVIDDGAHAGNVPDGLHFTDGLTATYVGATPFITDAGPGGDSTILVSRNTLLQSTGAGAFIQSNGAVVFLNEFAAVGDGVHVALASPLNGMNLQVRGGSELLPSAVLDDFAIVADASSHLPTTLTDVVFEDQAFGVAYASDFLTWGANGAGPPTMIADSPIDGGQVGALDLLARVLSNHVQQSGATGAVVSPNAMPDVAFTCLGAGLKVRVHATCDAASSSAAIDFATLKLQLDDADIAGSPTPAPGIGIGSRAESSIFWDVVFPDNAAHHVRLVLTSGGVGGTTLTVQQWTMQLQELLN